MFSPFRGKGTGQVYYTTFSGMIRSATNNHVSSQSVHRCYVDDTSVFGFNHLLPELTGADKSTEEVYIQFFLELFVGDFFGIGYGAYYSTADMPIPMVADCADYETYRSGKFIPGIMGTLFSLVDKLVSSLSSTVVFVAVSFIGYQGLPTKTTPYMEGMNWVVIALFCLVPMVAWALTLLAMKGYELDGKRIKTIQAVNSARKDAIAKGMSMEEALKTITDETVKS